MKFVVRLALGGIAVGLAVLGLKYAAYVLTGSVALYSDALESIVNVATAVTTFLAVRLSAMPPDANHPYGHHKVEYLSAVVEGVLIGIAALAILRKAYLGYLEPRPLDAPMLGLALNGLASAVNALWCFTLFRYGKRARSPALVADAKHLLTDVITSAGVLAGVALVAMTGVLVLDALIAALVALHILWWGWQLMRQSIGGLMDEAVSKEMLEKIRKAISTEAQGAIEAHDLRTRHAGRTTFIEFHLVVPGTMTVAESHAICDRVEAALKEDLPHAVITIHVEPEEKAKLEGVPVV
ncbi:cation diffusion facilitator family transporter [Methyloceanibacter sp.]|uniref:cation diffusion facilitator family transporter n=1 Tax=Methyloceanibacter sp. TaxID=1965321 RepID=UPI002D321773|nr:cation diffusion facilitator family transporter [Methyloceanibacter sp.]HZP09716.1 cation diffusion facilitator family transporter [Methyloceanibacter sp.]